MTESLAGDSFTFTTMLKMQQRDWVKSLFVPWIIFFALAAVASVFSLCSKLHFFVRKMRSRMRREVVTASMADPIIDELLDVNEFQKRKIYTYVPFCRAMSQYG